MTLAPPGAVFSRGPSASPLASSAASCAPTTSTRAERRTAGPAKVVEADLGATPWAARRGVRVLWSGLHLRSGFVAVAEADLIIVGDQPWAFLHNFGSLGDLNGDCFDDLIAGARWAKVTGRAYIFLGPRRRRRAGPLGGP